MNQPTHAREIKYDRITGDFALYLDGELVGWARTYQEGETTLNELVFEILTERRDAEAERAALVDAGDLPAGPAAERLLGELRANRAQRRWHEATALTWQFDPSVVSGELDRAFEATVAQLHDLGYALAVDGNELSLIAPPAAAPARPSLFGPGWMQQAADYTAEKRRQSAQAMRAAKAAKRDKGAA